VDFSLLICLLLAFVIGFVTAWLMRNFHWRERLAAQEARLFAVERDLNAWVDRGRSFDAQLDASKAALLETQQQLAACREDIGRYAEDAKRLDEDLAQANEVKSAALKRLDDSQRLLAAREADLDRHKADQGMQQARLLKLEADVNQRGAQLSDLRAAHANLEADLSARSSQLSGATSLLQTAQQRIVTLEAELKSALDNHSKDLKGWETKFTEMGALIRKGPRAAAAQVSSADKPARVYRQAPEQIDDLVDIHGVGPKLAALLNTLGVYQFRQIASWDDEDIAWFDARLEQFRGRIVREKWVESARECQRKKYG
jgi:predicted flap endonuclease-1-like 5' DNA nuclease